MASIDINGKQVEFTLKVIGNTMYLEATHIDGSRAESGNILSIDGTGYYNRSWSINSKFGFVLNSDGKIKQSK